MRLVKTDPLLVVDVCDLADDVIDARESAMVEQNAADEIHNFVFDPKAFQEEHSDLIMQEYEMDESTLLSWAKRVTAVRCQFAEKAQSMLDVDDRSLSQKLKDS